MEKTIETIWKEGFLKSSELLIPQINIMYNQKSKNIIEKLFDSFKNSLKILIALTIAIPFVMLLLKINFWWSITPSLFCLFWFFNSKRQFSSLKSIDYNTNCYAYLKSIDSKLKSINKINLRNTVLGVGFMLLPLVTYTYYANQDKNIGEIVGIGYVDLPNELIFIVLPITMLITIPFYIIMSKMNNKIEIKIKKLLRDMEELDQQKIDNNEV